MYYQFFRISEALGEYRCGRPAEAMALLKATTVTTPHRLLIEALALAQLGRRSEALRRFYQVLAATDWSPARAVSPDPWIAHVLRREAETVLVPDLNAWLAGTAYPRDDLEWEVFESICFVRREYAAGARRLAEALAAHPKMSGHRYNAACLAARAGEGAGPEAAR